MYLVSIKTWPVQLNTTQELKKDTQRYSSTALIILLSYLLNQEKTVNFRTNKSIRGKEHMAV